MMIMACRPHELLIQCPHFQEGPLTSSSGSAGRPPDGVPLDRRLCQTGGINQNYTSTAGTSYHIQIEDRGPVPDRLSETEVRRVSVIIYANYGEANARIVHGRDHDFPDVRTHEHNELIKGKVAELALQARALIEERERRMVARIKWLVHEYYLTKSEAAKKEFEEANALFPFLFSRAWMELKGERGSASAASSSTGPPGAEAPPVDEVVYPLDPELREHVIEIERLVRDLGEDVKRLRQAGKADDILLQTWRKLVTRAQETLASQDGAGFTARRLEMTRNSLMTTWRQVKSRLKG